MTRRWCSAAAVALSAIALLGACRRGRAGAPEFEPIADIVPADPPPKPPTYADVAPILAAHCTGCHTAGGIAPFYLDRYEDARAHAAGIAEQTKSRRMPPWGAIETNECHPPLPWRGDPRLTDADIAILTRWAEAGAPYGEPRTQALATPTLDYLKNPTIEVWPANHYIPPLNREVHRCFVLDPKIPEGAWVDAISMIPDDPHQVHHAMLYTDPGGVAASLADASGGFDCTPTGSLGVNLTPNATLMSVWTPGVSHVELPKDVGIRIPPASKLILAVHYAPAEGPHEHGLWLVQLRTTPTKPSYVLTTVGIGNFGAPFGNGDGLLPGPEDGPSGPVFSIPANSREHVEQMQLTIGDVGGPVRLFGVMAHMHLAGTDMRVSLYDPQADRNTCLLETQWNFHWQHMYEYDAPLDRLPLLATGQKLRLRCVYDNSMQNPHLATELLARRMPVHDIELGDGTFDEMCLFIPQLLVRNPD
jgi:hypothetical protein